jgi:hypothetical protein
MHRDFFYIQANILKTLAMYRCEKLFLLKIVNSFSLQNL